MLRIEDIGRDVVSNVDGALSFGVVDLGTGLLLAAHQDSVMPPVIEKAVSVAVSELFGGPHATVMERLAHARRNASGPMAATFHEVHATTEHAHHFAKRIKDGRAAVVLVTKRTTSIGMAWAQLKAAVPRVEALLS